MSGLLPYNFNQLLEKRKNLLLTLQVELFGLPNSHKELIEAVKKDTSASDFITRLKDFEEVAEDKEEKNSTSLKEKINMCPTELTLKLAAYKTATDAFKATVEAVDEAEVRAPLRTTAKTTAEAIINAVHKAFDLLDTIPDFESIETAAKSIETLIKSADQVKSTKNFSDFISNEKRINSAFLKAVSDIVNSNKALEKIFVSREEERLSIQKTFTSTFETDNRIIEAEKIASAICDPKIAVLNAYIAEQDRILDDVRKRALPQVEQMFSALPDNIPSVTKTSSPSNSPSLAPNNDRRDSPSKIVVPVSQGNNHFSKFKPAENKVAAENNKPVQPVSRSIFSRLICS